MPKKKTIKRGNTGERLYLQDLDFDLPTGAKVIVKATNEAGVDMPDLIARHKGRYYLVGLFCRPGLKVLDFPCGSGYAAEILRPLGVKYKGLDLDPYTIEYARRLYGGGTTQFAVGDLRKPPKGSSCRFDVITCIEGLEHIEMKYQDNLIASLKSALKPGGVLVVSSPENPTGTSGKSVHNEYHLGELTRSDFLALLHRHFHSEEVELITHKNHLSTGVYTACLYGICHKR